MLVEAHVPALLLVLELFVDVLKDVLRAQGYIDQLTDTACCSKVQGHLLATKICLLVMHVLAQATSY